MFDRTKLNQIMDYVSSVLSCLNLECIETSWNGQEQTLVCYIDVIGASVKERGSRVDINVCEKAHRLLKSKEIDPLLTKLIGFDCSLEVSSPGINPPVRKISDIQECIGSSIVIKEVGAKSKKKVVLEGVEGSSIVVRVSDQVRRYEIDKLTYIHLDSEG